MNEVTEHQITQLKSKEKTDFLIQNNTFEENLSIQEMTLS
jgi:hypothetical protein